MNENETELKPKYDNRKSFYGKATTRKEGNKLILKSYNTDVAFIVGINEDRNTNTNNDKLKAIVNGLYSNTTTRHIKEFLKQNGFKAETSKDILKEYGDKQKIGVGFNE